MLDEYTEVSHPVLSALKVLLALVFADGLFRRVGT